MRAFARPTPKRGMKKPSDDRRRCPPERTIRSGYKPRRTCEYRRHLRGRNGPAEQEALRLIDAVLQDRCGLRLGLHAFRRDRQIESATQAHHGADEYRALAGHDQFLDEALVDLELVETQLVEVIEAGIAGAEIVDDNPDAGIAQRLNGVPRRL